MKILTTILCIFYSISIACQAATVSFENFDSSNPGLFLESGVQVDDTLTLDLDNFQAVGAGTGGFAFDTLSFDVVANPGHIIGTIMYRESGSATRDDFQTLTQATGSVVVEGDAESISQFLMFGGPATNTWALELPTPIDVTHLGLDRVSVQITNSLVAAGNADILKDFVQIEVATVPIPAPVALLASALGILVLRRARQNRAAA